MTLALIGITGNILKNSNKHMKTVIKKLEFQFSDILIKKFYDTSFQFQ